MRLFFVNTDAVSYDGVRKHEDWLRRGVVIAGGEPKYKHALARIPKGARVLVYVNGVVAVGDVTSDNAMEVTFPDTIYPTDQPEYHRLVAWLLDLRANPITLGIPCRTSGPGSPSGRPGGACWQGRLAPPPRHA